MSEENIVNLTDWKRYKEHVEEMDRVVEELGTLVNGWKDENLNGVVIGFVGVAFFADIIRQLAPDEEAAEELLQTAVTQQIFDDWR
tara:strand:+ start:1079 stop:1336 length:258 start_codon:yes stop_codon:yes gene_type:complete